VALAGCLLLLGCAGIPDSSAPRVIEAIPSTGVADEPDVRFQPRPPQPGQTPQQIVEGFLEAESSPELQHAVARQFLAPAASGIWRDDAGTAVLAPSPTLVPSKSGAEVTLQGTQVGSVDPDGSYATVAAGRQTYGYRIQLERVNGEWRIANPPAGLVLTESSFRQVYRRRLNVYFLARNESRVVPDPRWFSAPREALPNLLLKALLDGPSTGLSDAVKTELAGAHLASNVVPESDRVRVFLTGLADRGAIAQAAGSAQIVWTLSQLSAAPAVEIDADVHPLIPRGVGQVQTIQDWRSYDPDALPLHTPGYFIRNGAVWTTDGEPAPGPAGSAGYGAQSVAVSSDLSRLAVVRRSAGGVALYLGSSRQELRPRLSGASLTPPSWDPMSGAVWTVRDGTDIIQVPARGMPFQVAARDLDRAQPISQLRLSRDGSRVALLAGSAGNQVLYVGAISAAGSAVTELRSIVPELTDVRDVSWTSADELMVLSGSPDKTATIYTVGVDGSLSQAITSYGLPTPPTAVAAAPGQAMLAVAAGHIWRLGDPRSAWMAVPPQPSGLADSAPAYPD